MKTKAFLAFLLVQLPLFATVTLNFEGGTLFGDNTSSPLAAGRLVVAVTTANNDFSGPVSGGFVSGGDTVLGSWFIDSGFAGPGTYSASLNLALGGGIATGQKVAIYWFTDISSIGSAPTNGTKYGMYRESSWLVPADSSLASYSLETVSLGGSVANSLTVANLTVSAVPEPSTCAALFGATALGFCALRRRRKVA